MNHPDHRDQLPSLKRIEGQSRGIRKMIEEEKYCIDILDKYVCEEKFNLEKNEECCICKVGDDEKIVKLKCNHMMHYECVKTWFIDFPLNVI